MRPAVLTHVVLRTCGESPVKRRGFVILSAAKDLRFMRPVDLTHVVLWVITNKRCATSQDACRVSLFRAGPAPIAVPPRGPLWACQAVGEAAPLLPDLTLPEAGARL